jgi:methylmalonyl-CoA mutase
MDKLFLDFPKVSKEKWEEKLLKELKGADFETSLRRSDEIEDFKYSTYTHNSDMTNSNEVPGMSYFKRGVKTENNDWNIGAMIVVSDEKESNKKALDLLMTGCTSLIFDFKNNPTNFSALFNEIGFEFIQTQFKLYSLEQYVAVKKYFSQHVDCRILYRMDFLNSTEMKMQLRAFSDVDVSRKTRFCHVNAFEIQQCGANISQEISFGLAVGHEFLVELMEAGFTIDEAANSIHFSVGIGANYFYEIAKIRAFRVLWAKIVQAYHPTDKASAICVITAEVGHMNKSLKDPYTNLLRQTTEAMAAISAGVETLIVHPYDAKSVDGISVLSSRMALNISLILKDESYFDKVIDPIGGSYSIEKLTEIISENTWKMFQEIDSKGGVFSMEAVELITSNVTEKADIRKERVKSGKQLMIGVNKYPNPLIETNSWLGEETYFGLKKVVFERDIRF